MDLPIAIEKYKVRDVACALLATKQSVRYAVFYCLMHDSVLDKRTTVFIYKDKHLKLNQF